MSKAKEITTATVVNVAEWIDVDQEFICRSTVARLLLNSATIKKVVKNMRQIKSSLV